MGRDLFRGSGRNAVLSANREPDDGFFARTGRSSGAGKAVSPAPNEFRKSMDIDDFRPSRHGTSPRLDDFVRTIFIEDLRANGSAWGPGSDIRRKADLNNRMQATRNGCLSRTRECRTHRVVVVNSGRAGQAPTACGAADVVSHRLPIGFLCVKFGPADSSSLNAVASIPAHGFGRPRGETAWPPDQWTATAYVGAADG